MGIGDNPVLPESRLPLAIDVNNIAAIAKIIPLFVFNSSCQIMHIDSIYSYTLTADDSYLGLINLVAPKRPFQ
ncbi:MAG: hypothetical protein A4E47_00450 [Methanosaeta sp. PtaU1.Bin028]|nr:MAG: hypothetical protein A4E47_00450 [Methanosaeta sp. PtaU1.Bin028]